MLSFLLRYVKSYESCGAPARRLVVGPHAYVRMHNGAGVYFVELARTRLGQPLGHTATAGRAISRAHLREHMEPPVGIEPTTFSLRVRRSAD